MVAADHQVIDPGNIGELLAEKQKVFAISLIYRDYFDKIAQSF
jgi:hypothetical protein